MDGFCNHTVQAAASSQIICWKFKKYFHYEIQQWKVPPSNLSYGLELSDFHCRGPFCFSIKGTRGGEKVSASFEIQLGDSACHWRSGIKGPGRSAGNKTYQLKEASDVDKKDAQNICAKHIISLGISHTPSKHQFRRGLEFGHMSHWKTTLSTLFIWSFLANVHI